MENTQRSLDDQAKKAFESREQHQAKIFYEQAVGRLLDVFTLDEAKKIMLFYQKHIDDNS